MASISKTTICNRALQHLGAARILDITDDNKNGRACNASYDSVRRAELRAHRWRFAIKRQALAATTDTDPLGDYLYIFNQPSDCLRILKPRDDQLDWQVEGRKIFTNDGGTLYLRYIKDEEDPAQFDAMFIEMFALKLAMAMCEEITGSNTRLQDLKDQYKTYKADARMTNAFETLPAEPEDDPWIVVRR